MKFKVLAYTFSVPLFWLTVLLLQLAIPDFGIFHRFSFAVLIGLLIGSTAGRFFLDRKYLTSISIDDEKLLLTYLTPLARQQQVTIRLDIINDIKLKEKIFLIRDFTSLKFLNRDNEIKFYLLNSDVKRASQKLLQTYSDKQMASRT